MAVFPPRHYAYVLEESFISAFKIGESQYGGEVRLREEALRIARECDFPPRIELVAEWEFRTREMAVYFEQLIIRRLRREEYPKVDRCDWYIVKPASRMLSIVEDFTPYAETLRVAEAAGIGLVEE